MKCGYDKCEVRIVITGGSRGKQRKYCCAEHREAQRQSEMIKGQSERQRYGQQLKDHEDNLDFYLSWIKRPIR